jgi:hypothetical protein
MLDASAKWKEMKAKFLRDFTPSEQVFFLKKAKECAGQKGYPASEDLFNYCYFLTLRERLRLIDPQGGESLMRFMLVESRKEIEDEMKVYEKRLEAKKQPILPTVDYRFIEYLSR